MDADDVSDNLTYRCPKCSKCQECRNSTKNRAISTQERVEQAVIEESVKLDLGNKKVTVELPLMKDPVKYLEEKHGSDSNYSQAKRVYITQCRKPDHIKAGIRKAHAELLEKDFMTKLENLDQEKQD